MTRQEFKQIKFIFVSHLNRAKFISRFTSLLILNPKYIFTLLLKQVPNILVGKRGKDTE